MSVAAVHGLVSGGRITAAQGAMLLALRRDLAWYRQSRWIRWLKILARAVSP